MCYTAAVLFCLPHKFQQIDWICSVIIRSKEKIRIGLRTITTTTATTKGTWSCFWKIYDLFCDRYIYHGYTLNFKKKNDREALDIGY